MADTAKTYAELRFGLEKKESEGVFNEVNAIMGKITIIDFNDSPIGTLRENSVEI